MNIQKTQSRRDLEKVIGISIFSALAFIIALICNIIPPIAGFLSLDVKDAVIAIASFIYGPISGVVIAFIAAFIEFLTFSTTGWYGFVMNFASSAVFSLTAALIYKRIRTINGAIISFLAAVVATTGVMLLLNNFVTPFYLVDFVGMPKNVATETVIGLLPKVLLPFNFAKSLLNASIAVMLYKPLLLALSKAKIIKQREVNYKFNRNSVIILSVGAVFLAVAVVIFLIIS